MGTGSGSYLDWSAADDQCAKALRPDTEAMHVTSSVKRVENNSVASGFSAIASSRACAREGGGAR